MGSPAKGTPRAHVGPGQRGLSSGNDMGNNTDSARQASSCHQAATVLPGQSNTQHMAGESEKMDVDDDNNKAEQLQDMLVQAMQSIRTQKLSEGMSEQQLLGALLAAVTKCLGCMLQGFLDFSS